MLPSIVRRVETAARSRLPVGRVGRAFSCSHLSHLRLSRHSLVANNLNDEAKKTVKNAAGSGVSITF